MAWKMRVNSISGKFKENQVQFLSVCDECETIKMACENSMNYKRFSSSVMSALIKTVSVTLDRIGIGNYE